MRGLLLSRLPSCLLGWIIVCRLASSEAAYPLLLRGEAWEEPAWIETAAWVNEGGRSDAGIGFDTWGGSVAARLRVRGDARDTLLFEARAKQQEFDSTAPLVFPSGLQVPERLQDFRLGVLGRRIDGAGRRWVGALSVGSASDEAFASVDEMLIDALAAVHLPTAADSGWTLGAMYKTTLGLPLPLIVYSWQPRPRTFLSLGVPVFNLRMFSADFSRDLRLSLLLAAIGERGGFFEAEAGWRVLRPLRLFASVNRFTAEGYPVERPDDDTFLRLQELRLGGGAEWYFQQHRSLRLEAGWAVARELVELRGQTLFDREDDEIGLDSGLYARLSADWRF